MLRIYITIYSVGQRQAKREQDIYYEDHHRWSLQRDICVRACSYLRIIYIYIYIYAFGGYK